MESVGSVILVGWIGFGVCGRIVIENWGRRWSNTLGRQSLRERMTSGNWLNLRERLTSGNWLYLRKFTGSRNTYPRLKCC